MPTSTRLPTFDRELTLPGRFHFPARMTVLPLAEGKIALVSPVAIDDALAAQIAALGEVSLLIAPNLLHHLYLGAASERYPRAHVLAPRGLRKKRPDLRIDGDLEADLPSALTAAVEVLKIESAPSIDEFVFYHRALRSLLVTDLVFHVRRPRGFTANLVLFLVGCHGRFAQSRVWRTAIKQRAAACDSMERVLDLPFEELVMAHGDVVQSRPREQLASAMHWLLARRKAPAASASR